MGGWTDGRTGGRMGTEGRVDGRWCSLRSLRTDGWNGGARSARCGRMDGRTDTDGRSRTDRRMDVRTAGRTDRGKDGWTDGRRAGCTDGMVVLVLLAVDGRMDGWVDGRRMDGRLDGQTDSKDGWTDGWTDGWNGGARSARCGRTIGWADPLAAQDYLYKCDSQSFTPPQKKHQIYRTGLSKVIFLLVILPHLFGSDPWIPRSDDLNSQ